MNTAVLVCRGPRCAAQRGRIVCLLISQSICESPLQQAAPSDEPRNTSRLSTRRTPLECLSNNEERASFSAHSTFSLTHPLANQTETRTATLLSESAALGCKKAASWQLTKASPLWAGEMKEEREKKERKGR